MPRVEQSGPLDSPIVETADIAFTRVNARLRPDQLQAGELASSINGRMGVDGSWQVRKGVHAFGPGVFSGDDVLTLPFYLYANVVIGAASRVDDLVTVTTSGAHSFVDQTIVSISDVSGVEDPEGNRFITVTGASEFTFVLDGATGNETYTLGASPAAGSPILPSAVPSAYGSCLFSDPSDDSEEYIIIAENTFATAIKLSDATSSTIAYPTGLTVVAECDLLQTFDKVYLFRDGLTSWEWNGDFSGTPAFTKVANGDYAATVYLNAATNTVLADGVATVSETTHGLSVGEKVYVIDNGSTALVEGAAYVVATVPTANSFTFYAQVPDAVATAVIYSRKLSDGRGFTHMPAPPWGVYHQRRLWAPFYYTTTGTSGSEVITSRDVRDEIIVSDILDADTYDQLVNQHRVTAGVADYLVGLHPFNDDTLIAFNRNSVHQITGGSGDLIDIQIKLVTREAGLVARKSLVQIANSVYFLSDNGIYAATFGDEYNLRGAGLPLSDPIQPIIDRINSQYAQNAVAVFHDNRYWIAVPLDDSTVNNAVLVYNLLNPGWESVDQIDDVNWNVTNLITAGAGGVNKLYAINTFGGLHIIDDREDDQDFLVTIPGTSPSVNAISSEMVTRRFTMGAFGRKRWKYFDIHVESSASNQSDATISGITENLDDDFQITTIGALNHDEDGNEERLEVAEDASFRGRIGGKRAYGLQLKIVPTAGRPLVRMISVGAAEAFKSLNKAV